MLWKNSVSWKYKEKMRDPKRKVKTGLQERTTGERRQYREEEWSYCLQNGKSIMYAWGVISVHNGPNRSFCQCLSYVVASYRFSVVHMHSICKASYPYKFHCASCCALCYPTSSSEFPQERLLALFFQFTLLFPHQSPNVVVFFSSPIPSSSAS